MKKVKFSRVLAVMLALVITVGAVPLTALPASAATTSDGLEYSISNGEVTITDYTGTATELEIPATIEGYPVTSIGEDAFWGCSSLTSITIPEGLTSIGDNAFESCSSLTSVIIPEGVTSIGSCTFQYCSSLTSITIPDGVTSIGSSAFRGCESLTSITIPEGVTSIGASAFFACSSLTSITIPESVTSINPRGVFSGCPVTIYGYRGSYAETYANENSIPFAEIIPEGLQYTIENGEVTITGYTGSATELEIPSEIEGCPVTVIGDSAFKGCSTLERVVVPESVTQIDTFAFFYCNNLLSITLPKTVKRFGPSVFEECHKLKDVTIPDGITYICMWTFRGCESLESIIIPDSVKHIEHSAFMDCTSLTSITIPEGVTSIGEDAFYNCSSLTTVYYGGTKEQWNSISIGVANDSLINAEIIFLGEPEEPEIPEGLVYEIADGEVTITDYTGSATELEIPATIEDCPVTSIASYAFDNCTSLEQITLPEGITSIGDCSFYNCQNLEYINLPQSLTSIGGWAFWRCIKLTSLIIPPSVTSISSGIVNECHELVSLTADTGNTTYYSEGNCIISRADNALVAGCNVSVIPKEVTRIGVNAFSNSVRIESLIIPEGVFCIDYCAFSGCTSLTSITFPAGLTSVGPCAFSNCGSLKTVYYDGTEEQWSSISIGAANEPLSNAEIIFRGEPEEPAIPEGLEYRLSGRGSSRRIVITKYTGDATELDIPEWIEGYPVLVIGDSAFEGCSGLTSITIPEGVTSIGDSAFEGCSGLTTVYYGGTREQWSSISIGSYNEPLTNAEIIFLGEPDEPAIPEGLEYSIYNGEVTITDYTETATELEIPATIEGCPVTSIGDFAFWDCESLTSITIPEGVTSIGDYAFYECTSLTSITLPAGLTSIGDFTFWGCSSLTSITIPEGLTSIGDLAFDYCTSLATVYYGGTREQWNSISIGVKNDYLTSAEIIFLGEPKVPDGLQYSISNGEVTITGYTGSATVLEIPAEIDGYPVTSIDDYAFSWCTSLTSITLPAGLTSIGDWAFHSCTSLTSITIPEGVTSIGSWAFWCCTSLESVILPEEVTYIGVEAFSACESLASITIPASVTTIDAFAFWGCSSLTSITIPEGVTSIGEGAFYYCTSLATVYYGGTREQWSSISIGSDNEPLTNAEIIFLGESEEPEIILGDLDGDGKVNSKDVNLIKRLISGAIDPTESQKKAADVNGDGSLNALDANLMSKIAAGAN